MVYLLLTSIIAGCTSKANAPLKIGILYYTTIDKNLKKELEQNILATYKCTVTEIKGIAKMPDEAYYKPRNRYRANKL